MVLTSLAMLSYCMHFCAIIYHLLTVLVWIPLSLLSPVGFNQRTEGGVVQNAVLECYQHSSDRLKDQNISCQGNSDGNMQG